MFSKLRSHLSYANVISTLCVFIVLGGSSYAAITLTKDSVKSRHIAKGQVKRSDLAENAVTSAKVANGGLLAEDFAPGQLPAGERGPEGQRGPNGRPGADGAPATKLFA
jgi:hypothetical protein